MLLYILGLGTATNPLPSSAWSSWTRGYTWATNYGQIFIPFPPLFGHQYSHCWIDFRHIADSYMQAHSSSYFENSRRATLAQRAYCIANPANRVGYGSNVWGLTASDSSSGYVARGAPPAQNDDGTIAPTAVGGSMPFTPEYSVPALRNLYSSYRTNLWTAYGFRDAFNLGQSWYDTDELGIDQGPFVIMIENYRTQRVWRLFMQNMEIQRGLGSAGFSSLPWVSPLTLAWAGNTCTVSWPASGGLSYQVEYSPDLDSWAASPGFLSATNTGTFNWADIGPPVTVSAPNAAATRFYRVFQLGL
jgi:hypothetical protein